MIRQLRYKFIAVTMLCIGALFLLILLVIQRFHDGFQPKQRL